MSEPWMGENKERCLMLGTFYANVGVVPSPSTLLIRSPQKKPQSPWEVTPRSGSLPVMCTTTQLEADTPPWRLPDALAKPAP